VGGTDAGVDDGHVTVRAVVAERLGDGLRARLLAGVVVEILEFVVRCDPTNRLELYDPPNLFGGRPRVAERQYLELVVAVREVEAVEVGHAVVRPERDDDFLEAPVEFEPVVQLGVDRLRARAAGYKRRCARRSGRPLEERPSVELHVPRRTACTKVGSDKTIKRSPVRRVIGGLAVSRTGYNRLAFRDDHQPLGVLVGGRARPVAVDLD